ncbi:MAG: lipopolysaccharide biosynthesis protein [Flavobacteriales bacterium]|nr:lipopolysaccharide biosynthesis protein [Flavobacteriales bacterium]
MRKALARRWKDEFGQVSQRGSFANSAAHVFSGSSLVILSQLVLTPIIARIYGPEAYGVYGLFLALSLNLAQLSDPGLFTAYVLPRDHDRFLDLVRLDLICFAAVLLLMLPFCLAHEMIYTWVPAWSILGGWALLLPLGVAVQFLPNLFTNWLIREKNFRASPYLGGGTNLVLRVFNLIYGLFSKGAVHGLIVGEVAVRGVGLLAYWKAIGHGALVRVLTFPPWARLRETLHEYRMHPLVLFPERYVALLGQQVPIFMLVFDPAALGQFAFAGGLLLMPLRLFGYSLGVVFQQRIAESQHDKPHDLPRITIGVFNRLMMIGVVPFAAITFFSDVIFQWVLGDAWVVSGIYTAYMGHFFLFRLVSEPLTSAMLLKKRQHYLLIFQLVMLAGRFLAVMVAEHMFGSANAIVLAFSAVSTAAYLFYMTMLLRNAGVPWTRPVLRMLAILCALDLLFALLRHQTIGSWFPGS